MYIPNRVKLPLFSSDFNESCIFSTVFENKIVEFHENPSAGTQLFHADGLTDMTKVIVFANFAKAPKINTVTDRLPMLYKFHSKFHENPSIV